MFFCYLGIYHCYWEYNNYKQQSASISNVGFTTNFQIYLQVQETWLAFCKSWFDLFKPSQQPPCDHGFHCLFVGRIIDENIEKKFEEIYLFVDHFNNYSFFYLTIIWSKWEAQFFTSTRSCMGKSHVSILTWFIL